MIAVVGSPTATRRPVGVGAAGLAVAIGRAGVAAGASVQLIGKVGEGPDGDAILLDIASAGIGHVAVLRDLEPVAVVDLDAAREPGPSIEAADLADIDDHEGDRETPTASGPGLDAGDLELALRYLPEYAVVVIAQALDAPALEAVVAAAGWAGARL